MNFDKVNTVKDLCDMNNKTKTPLENAVDALAECGAVDSKLICCYLIKNMMDWHHTVADGLEDNEQANAWAFDEGKLWSALQLMKSINVGDNNNEE